MQSRNGRGGVCGRIRRSSVERGAWGGELTDYEAVLADPLNPLHVYCRLRDIGIPKRRAAMWTRRYERWMKKTGILKKR